jgi:hypothetical protein
MLFVDIRLFKFSTKVPVRLHGYIPFKSKENGQNNIWTSAVAKDEAFYIDFKNTILQKHSLKPF